MSRPLAWICLILAIGGPSLTQAELADDLGRSLVESRDEGIVQPTDGGVGDEPIEASFAPAAPELDLAASIWTAPADFAAVRKVELLSGPVLDRFHRIGPVWPPPTTTRRHVWLQTFLI